MVTVRSTEIRHLTQALIEAGIVPGDRFVSAGLPGVPDRAITTLLRVLGPDHGGRAMRVAALAELPDETLRTVPGLGPKTLEGIRQGLLDSLLIHERQTAGGGVTWLEIGPNKTTPLIGEMVKVSNPCREGRHYRCSGKIALQQLERGRRYARCRCPYCNHPKITTMPLKG